MGMTDQRKVEMIVELKQSAQNARRDRISKFQKYYKMFNGILDYDESYPWRSKIFMKEVYKVIDTIHPIFMDMIFMKGEAFRVKGVDSPINTKQASILSALIAFYIEKMDAYDTIDDFVTELLITGTAFAKMYWEVKTIKREEEVESEVPRIANLFGKELQLGNMIETNREIVTRYVKDNPTIEHISYKDIFFSTKAKNFKNTWIIHRTWKTLDQLKNKNKKYKEVTGENFYKNLGQLELLSTGVDCKDGDPEDSITRDEKSELGINNHAGLAEVEDPQPVSEDLKMNNEGEIEILEYWNKDGSEVSVVAGGMVLIKDEMNPFEHKSKPFIYSNYKRRPQEIWGIGICELAEDGQDLLNTSVNQSIDSNTLVNNLMVAVSADANIDQDQLKARPGGYVEIDVDPGEAISSKFQQLKFSKVDASSEIALAMNEIREVTGASKLMQGTYESGAVRNTSQARLMMTASNKKFMGKVLTFESMFLKPFIRMFYALIMQYMTRDQVVRILGDKGAEYVKVQPTDICLDLDFVPVGTRQLVEMEQLVHQLNNFLAVVSRIPMAQAIVKFKVLIRKIAENLLGAEVASEILMSDEESKALMQQMMQQQNQQGQGGGNPNPSLGGQNPSQPNSAGGVQ
jgi:hypothetical protein